MRLGVRHLSVIGSLTVAFWTPTAAAQQVTSKVDKVLVYSTQARVYHVATVTGLTAKAVELVDLPPAARHDSVQVTCITADVERVEVVQSRGRLPRQVKTEEMVKQIEAVLDRMQDLEYEGQVLQGELALVESLALRREPNRDRAPVEGMFADVWRRILTWMDGRSSRARARLRTLAGLRREQQRALFKLQVDARSLNLEPVNTPVYRVVATLKGGGGRHRLNVSYLVDNARWVPSYDLRYDAGRRVVEATYYAVVSQSTGADWERARMQFSTTMPTQLLAVPELATWTLGRKRDFMPTPRRQSDPAPSPWQPPEPVLPADPVVEHLRGLLQQRGPADRGERDKAQDEDNDGVPDVDDLLDGAVGGKDRAPPPMKRPLVEPGPVADGRHRIQVKQYEAESETLAQPSMPAPAPMAAADAPPPSAPGRASVFGGSSGSSYKPTESLPWNDEGYQPPQVDPDLPAAAAQGYRFTLYAPGVHTVPSGGRLMRIPVLRRQLKVRPYYSLRPGASAYAYLMAEVKNTTGRPILRGHANLFTGDMFSGRSWLNTSLPGQTINLPLGVDDAIKIERHARQRTVVEGMIFKDDVSEYTIEIEVANHHRYPVEVELQDQIPVIEGRKVEVKAFSSGPKMKDPDKQGMVTWKGTVGASAVKKLKLTFQIVRPKDWDLRQHDG